MARARPTRTPAVPPAPVDTTAADPTANASTGASAKAAAKSGATAGTNAGTKASAKASTKPAAPAERERAAPVVPAAPPAGATPAPPAHALPDDLLFRAPDEAVRVLALALLEQAAVARARLGVPGDSEALHDFRVALRRLRSVLRAYRPELKGSVDRRAERRLRKLNRASGAGRDLEVQLEWLDGQRGSLYSRHRTGAQWLRERLLAAKRDADAHLAERIGPAFDKAQRGLARTLPVYWRRSRVGAPAVRAHLAPVLAARLRELTAALGASLRAVTGPEAVEESHEARIAAKRVRYLLEPVKAHVEGAGAALSRLRKLQGALGELHDLDVLADVLAAAMADAEAEHEALETARARAAAEERRVADAAMADAAATERSEGAALGDGGSTTPVAPAVERRQVSRDPRPGLAGLTRRARARREVLFAEIAASWLAGAGAALVADLDLLAAALDATADPHAPPLEIERKFLLRSLPHALRGRAHAEIEQGWLPGTRLLERLRRVRRDGEERLYRTVKLGSGVSRIEVEEETTPELFAVLWPATAARRVRKRRWAVPDGGQTWEVDEFLGRELVLAEVELPSPDTPATPPSWLAPYVVREVTDDPAYVNANLARAESDG